MISYNTYVFVNQRLSIFHILVILAITNLIRKLQQNQRVLDLSQYFRERTIGMLQTDMTVTAFTRVIG